jgi:hypothetical protein
VGRITLANHDSLSDCSDAVKTEGNFNCFQLLKYQRNKKKFFLMKAKKASKLYHTEIF